MPDTERQELLNKTPEPCCAKCRFWYDYEDKDWDGGCRKRAPVVVAEGEGEGWFEGVPQFPKTLYNWWCGEFEKLVDAAELAQAQVTHDFNKTEEAIKYRKEHTNG